MAAQSDFFLKIETVEGESQDSVHKKEIQIYDLKFGVKNTGRGGMGSGSSTGKATWEDMEFGKFVDKASPALFMACASGKTVGEATITCRKASGDKPIEYLVYKLKEVFVSDVKVHGEEDGGVAKESLKINFAFIEIAYTIQLDNGFAGPQTVKWADLKKNTFG
jgi:type VI secretion system secreted protein Hcp